MNRKTKTINRIREFNRFYTVMLGMLNRNFLHSEYSVTETRILFEIKTNEGCSANDIINTLKIDKSYLSRIINSFIKNQLITKDVLPEDRRAFEIRLTDKGHKTVDALVAKTNEQIREYVDSLNDSECDEICAAMDTITKYFQ